MVPYGHTQGRTQKANEKKAEQKNIFKSWASKKKVFTDFEVEIAPSFYLLL